VGMVKWHWPQSERGRHEWRHCSDRAVDGWAPAVLDFFQFIQTGSTLKMKMGALSCFTNSQFLHAASQQY
jgi:hypothetical protein